MKAIGKNIVIKAIKENGTTTKGGLLLAETHREDIRYRKGEVVETGTDVVGIKNDDKIFYDRRAGFNIELEDNVYTIIKEGDVVIVI